MWRARGSDSARLSESIRRGARAALSSQQDLKTAFRSHCARPCLTRCDQFRLLRVAGASEGCRFAAAGPNNVRQARPTGRYMSSPNQVLTHAARAAGPWSGQLHERGVLSEFRAARTCASYWNLTKRGWKFGHARSVSRVHHCTAACKLPSYRVFL